MDGIGTPRSYSKYEIFDDENDELSWDAAEKRAHQALREMGVPVESGPVVIIPSKPVHSELEAEKKRKPVQKKAGAQDLPPPLFQTEPPRDHKLEALAQTHVLLHWIRNNLCKDRPEVATWIDELLDKAPKK